MIIERLAHQLTVNLIDSGQLIEGGFAAFMLTKLAKPSGPDELRDLRLAFISGAEVMFTSMLNIMSTTTAQDLKRMESIRREVDKVRAELEALATQGSA